MLRLLFICYDEGDFCFVLVKPEVVGSPMSSGWSRIFHELVSVLLFVSARKIVPGFIILELFVISVRLSDPFGCDFGHVFAVGNDRVVR